MCQVAQIMRSNIHAGISSQRSDVEPAELQRQTSPLAHECEHGAGPKGAKDKEHREYRFHGRSVASLYYTVATLGLAGQDAIEAHLRIGQSDHGDIPPMI